MKWILVILIVLTGFVTRGVPEGFGVYGDTVFERKGQEDGTPPAVFPHWIHRIRYRCAACHPAIFEPKRGANPVSMETIQQGKFCGVCHNGKIAWGIHFETCQRCHVASVSGK